MLPGWGVRGGVRSGLAFGLGCRGVSAVCRGARGETRLESVDEPEEGFQRTRWGRRGGIHARVGEPGPTRAAICA
jgi:hypothetical protein